MKLILTKGKDVGVLLVMSVADLLELTSNSYLSESSFGSSDSMSGIMMVLTFHGGVLLCYVGVDAVPDTAIKVAKV